MAPTHEGSEHDIQARFFALVRQVLSQLPEDHPYQMATFAVPNGFLKTKAMRLRGWREGVLSGVADVIVAVPNIPYGGLFMELKVGGNRLSPEQRKFKRAMEKLGYRHEEAATAEDMFRLWCEHLRLEVQLS